MTRREFPKRVKAQAAERANGLCEQCGAKLRAGGYHYDHIEPDGLGGEPVLENCMVMCTPCHKVKTHTIDNPIMQKADRVRKKLVFGIPGRKGPPMPGTKASGLRKRFDGTVVRREP